MLANIKAKVKELKRAAGLMINIGDDARYYINGVVLTVKNGDIQKESVQHSVQDIGDISLAKATPVSLVLTGKGVLVKKIIAPEEQDGLLDTILPQANPNDFYIQIKKCDGFSIAAVARRTIVDAWLNMFEKEGFTILNIQLGFLSIVPIIPFIDISNEEIFIDSYCLTHNKQGIVDFAMHTKANLSFTQEFLVGNQYIQSLHLLAYGAAVSLMADNMMDTSEISASALDYRRSEFVYRKYIKATGVGLLTILLFLLILNFFALNYFATQNKQNAAIQQQFEQLRQQNNSLNEAVKSKEKFLTAIGWQRPEITSFLADRIAGFLPEDVWLTDLDFYPKSSSGPSDDNLFQFKRDTVLLSGSCRDAGKISTFINNLKTLNHIKSLTMSNYSYESEKDEGQFHLEIITQ